MPKMQEDEVKAIVQRELENALGIDGGKLSQSRRDALKYYEGQPFGNEMAGQSQVVSRDVMEVIEWVLPALLRIFTSGDETVRFEPQGPEDDAAAKQATEYVNFVFQRDNPGFKILYDWFKDALLSKNGFIKVFWDTQRRVSTEHYSGLTQDQLDALKADKDLEFIRATATDLVGTFDEQGNPQQVQPVFEAAFKRMTSEDGVKILNVPPDEILVSRRAVNMREMPFIAHRVKKSKTDLLEMGYSRKIIDDLPVDDEQEFNLERTQRFLEDDEFPYQSTRTDKPAEQVWIIEAYIRIDEDGDGIAELRKITCAGNRVQVILDDEEIDEIPIVTITPLPMPHKFFGMSLADLVMDIQLLKSVLWRQMLNNLYLSNNPRMAVIDVNGYANTSTIDDLLNVRPGGIVRMGAADAVKPLEVPFVADKTFPMMEYIDDLREGRTGVSKRNQGINPDDINKTAAGLSMMQQSAAQRVELIARVFAETGVKELFTKILGLVTRHQDRARTIRLRNNWVPMDPRNWKSSYDVTVSVGLGTGNKDQSLMHLKTILDLQQKAVEMQGGANGPIVTLENIYNAASKLIENAGFRNATDFVTDPQGKPQAPDAADPETQKEKTKAQAQVQAAQLKASTDVQIAQINAQNKLALAEIEAQNAMRIKQMQFDYEARMRKYEADLDAKVDMMTPKSTYEPRPTEFGGDQV